MNKWILTLLLLFPILCFSAPVPVWQIVPESSTLTFTATQNGAPVTGQFKKFNGEINFDPSQLKASNIKIIVDVSSISDVYNQLKDTLSSKDWFNAKAFPQAIFTSNSFAKIGDNTFTAVGTLTLRDKTLPLAVTFVLDQYNANNAHVKGTTIIKRTAFGVGQGEWADTKTILDNVKVDLILLQKNRDVMLVDYGATHLIHPTKVLCYRRVD